MGNKTSTSSEDLAAKNNITTEEVDALIAAFKAGNKKAGPVKLKKFKTIVAEVHKINQNDNFSPEAAELLFAVLDADKNGKVDTEEFITGIAVLSSGSIEDKAKLVFSAIDKNKSGKINKGEFRAYVGKTIDIAKEIYNRQSKDEGLNLAMRMGIKMAMKVGQGGIIDEITEEAFRADKDGDGEISLEEWIAAAKSGNDAIESFLNPGEQLKDGVKHIGEALSDAGLVTTKSEYNDLKKEIMN